MTREPRELSALARAWIEGDPDPDTRAELERALERGDWSELDARLTPLTFGTAGLRGEVGAGSGRMNVAVVRRAAYGIAQYVLRSGLDARPLVIGFDARPSSRRFAEASAGVWLAAGLRVVAFTEACATPLVAFMASRLQAAISVVVTASHNPRSDNGYKVYGPDAIQISAPTDAAIAARIAVAPPAVDIECLDAMFVVGAKTENLSLVQEAWLSEYYAALAQVFPAAPGARELRIMHSALHGVGSAPMRRALAEAGFSRVSLVPSQAEPDGTFPTTPFPNPEEPGTLDLALAEARASDSDLLLVSDPDADRLAAAARLDGALTVLDGNQLGVLLADYLLARARRDEAPLVLSSVVSTPLVQLLCQHRGARYERTHTGFKWLWHAALALEAQGAGRFCFAFEEALGYSVFAAVRDKDGIAAGRALAELSAELALGGRTLFDRLAELYMEYGLWASAARNVTVSGVAAAARIRRGLDALSTERASPLGVERVVRRVDYRDAALAARRPSWCAAAPLIELELQSGARLFVRPSGTEPKLKLYAHVKRSLERQSQLATALAEARQYATALLLELESSLEL